MKQIIFLFAQLFAFVFCLMIIWNTQREDYSSNLTSISEIHQEYCNDYSGDLSQSQMDDALDFISYRQGMNQDIGIDYYIEHGMTDIPEEQKNKSQNSIMKICTPWIILVGVSFILYFVTAYCFYNCCACKRCLFDKVQEFKNMWFPFLASILFNIVIFILSIYCVIETIDKPYNNLTCLISEIFSNASDGSQNSSWQGMTLFLSNLTEISNNIDSILLTSNGLAENISLSKENLTASYKELIEQNAKLGNISSSESFYQQNRILAYIANGTNVTDDNIWTEVASLIRPQEKLFDGFFNTTLTSILNLKEVSQQLSDGGDVIKTSAAASLKKTTLVMTGLQTAIDNFYTLTQDWNSKEKSLASYYRIYFYVFLGLSGAILLVSFVIGCDKYLGFSKLVYACVWVIYFVLTIVAFAACGIFQLKLQILVEGSNHFKNITTNQTQFQAINQMIPDEYFKDLLSQCLFQGGNISSILQIQYLSQITSFYVAVNQYQQESQQFSNKTDDIDKYLDLNSGYIDSFVTFQRIDGKEPNGTNETENTKYIARTAVKDCNNQQQSSVPDNMKYCDLNAFQFDPSNSSKNFTATETEPVCFQSMTFTTNRSLITKWIPNCDSLTQIDEKQQNQVKLWKDIPDQEDQIKESYLNITRPIYENIDSIDEHILKITQALSLLEGDNGLIETVQSQSCSIFSVIVFSIQTSINRVQLGFYGLILFYRIYWILNIVVACLLFFSGISMFRVLIDIYYIQNQPEPPIKQQNQSRVYEILPTTFAYQGKLDLTQK